MTSSMTLFDRLAAHPLMADLPPAWLHQLAVHGRPVSWPAGSRLLREGSPADRFWLLSSGQVERAMPSSCARHRFVIWSARTRCSAL